MIFSEDRRIGKKIYLLIVILCLKKVNTKVRFLDFVANELRRQLTLGKKTFILLRKRGKKNSIIDYTL